MNNTFNDRDCDDLFLESNEDFEPYGCADISESLKKIYFSIQAYKAGFDDREYKYYD